MDEPHLYGLYPDVVCRCFLFCMQNLIRCSLLFAFFSDCKYMKITQRKAKKRSKKTLNVTKS